MRWKLILGIAVSAAFLYLAFRGADLDRMLEVLRGADYLWMIPAVVLTLGSFAVRAWRWKYFLLGVGPLPFSQLFSATMVGFMGNNVLPARLGEFLRVHSIGKTSGISRSTALGSIVVERIFDLGVLLFLFATVLVAGQIPPDVRNWGIYLVAAAVPALGGAVLLRARPQWFLPWVERLAPVRFRARLLDIVHKFSAGLATLGNARAVVVAFALSMLMWGALVGVLVSCFEALDMELPAEAGVVVLVVLAVGTMVPSGPGFIGTLQIAGLIALGQYGIEEELALACTVLFHATQWFPVTAVGLWFFFRQQLSLSRIQTTSGNGPLGTPSIRE